MAALKILYCRVCPNTILNGHLGNYCKSCYRIPCNVCDTKMHEVNKKMCEKCDKLYIKYTNNPNDCYICDKRLVEKICTTCQKKICVSCRFRMCSLEEKWCNYCKNNKCQYCEAELEFGDDFFCEGCKWITDDQQEEWDDEIFVFEYSDNDEAQQQ